MKDKTQSATWRFRRAYRTAFTVMFSYLWLSFVKRFISKKKYETRQMATHIRNAERVKTAILELKGLFIKIGQLLSVLGNFLPEEFQKPLESLQDKIPPRPIEEVRERLLKEFGKGPKELFARFDELPLASASIGQAHRAKLHDGTEVVVKVQHANIEETSQVDLKIMENLVKLHNWFFDIKGFDYVYSQVRQMIEEELDFAKEAIAMQRIAENLRSEEKFEIPTVHPAFCTGRVLTTTWHSGVKIAELKQLDAWSLDKRELATRVLRAYSHMLFKDGYYHADPHPGNILVKEDGTIVLLDFGAVAELSSDFRSGFQRLIEAGVKNDTDAMIDAARMLGFIAKGQEATEMAEKMIEAMRNFLQNEVQMDGLNLKEIKVNPLSNSLTDLISEIGLSGIMGTVQVPKEWVLLNRTITLLLGICTTLDPSLNPLDVVRPYARDFVMGEKDSIATVVKDILKRTVTTSLGLPDELHRVLLKIEKGKLETRTPDIREAAKLLYQSGQQFLLAIMAIASAYFGYLFYEKNELLGERWGFGLAAFFLLLLLRSLRKGSKIRHKLD
ncbi:MAG: AarF/ABC1/UbiB kinase family protein [Bacteroidetes bacterium]|nr:AarF/ABC1/UbiB kinase family protein [Bacteroidota bacterium]